MRGVKHSNEYAQLLRWYSDIPKAVLAAICVSLVARCGSELQPTAVERAVLDEWLVLHQNGIVPQAPPKAEAR